MPVLSSDAVAAKAKCSIKSNFVQSDKRHGHKPRPAFLLAVVFLSTSKVAIAAEWSAAADLQVREEYNDNARFTAGPHSASWLSKVSPQIQLTGRTETAEATGTALFDLNRYKGDASLNRVDNLFSLASKLNTERSVWAFDASYRRDSTLAGVLGGSTTSSALIARRQTAFKPSWETQITEKLQSVLTYDYSNVNYPDGSRNGLVDYHNQSASGTLRYQLAERLQTVGSFYLSRFSAIPESYKAETTGFQAGLVSQITERLQATAMLGLRSTRSSIKNNRCIAYAFSFPNFDITCTEIATFSRETRSKGHVFNLQLNEQLETGSLLAGFSREINPSGIGALIQTDSINFTASRQLTPKWAAYLDASTYRSGYTAGGIRGSRVRYVRVEPRFEWRLDENLTINGGLVHANQRTEQPVVEANSNAVYMSATYRWPKMSVSR